MATFNKFNSFVENLAEGVHNLATGTITIAMCAAANAPTAAGSILTDLTQISYTGCSTRVVTTSTSAATGGTYKLVLTDATLTSSGTVGPFRYVVLYNDTAANDNLIGYYDYGSDISLLTGETLTIDFDGTNGVLQIV